MKLYLFAPIFCFLLTCEGLAGDTQQLYATLYKTGAPHFSWDVATDRLKQRSHWSVGNAPVPLSPGDAIQIAKRWIAAQPWSGRFTDFETIELRQLLDNEQSTGVWWYTITFGIKDDPEWEIPHGAVVLLDGSIVEPTKRAPVLNRLEKIEGKPTEKEK